MANPADILVKILADDSKMAEAFERQGKAAESWKEQVESVTGVSAKSMAAIASAVSGAALAVAHMTLSVARHIEEQDKLTQKTGISVQTLQEWSVVMEENGFNAETLAVGIKKLSETMVKGQTYGTAAADTLQELGIQSLSTETAIKRVADRFAEMPDGAEKARLAVELFGNGGLDLIPILNRGSAALDESAAASRRYGLVLSGEQVSALKAADDAYDNLGLAIQGVKTQLAATFAPALTSIITMIKDAIVVAKDLASSLDLGKSMEHLQFPGKGLQKGQTFTVPMPDDATLRAMGEAVAISKVNTAEMEKQEALGRKIVANAIHNFHWLEARRRDEEALGKVVNQIAERERNERNQAFANQIESEQHLQDLEKQFTPVRSKDLEKSLQAVKALQELMPELNSTEAATLAEHNRDVAYQQLELTQRVAQAEQQRIANLQEMHDGLEAEFNLQRAWYSQAPGLYGQADEARRKGFNALSAAFDLEMAKMEEARRQGEISQDQMASRTLALEMNTMAQRVAILQQYPTAFEQQMQGVINSNTFSLASITNQWTSATASWIRGVGDFKSVTDATLQSLLQSFLNFGVQQLAMVAQFVAQQIAMKTTEEAAKTGAAAAGSASRTAITAAEAGTEVGIMAGAQTTILGMFAAVGGALKALFLETLVPAVMAVGDFIVGVLTSIAAAMKATIFGIPIGIAILVGVAGIIAALAATKNLPGLAEGGLVRGPMVAQIGEAGPEAVIPLDRMDELGGGGAQPQTIILQVNSRELQRWVLDELPGYVRLRTGIAAA